MTHAESMAGCSRHKVQRLQNYVVQVLVPIVGINRSPCVGERRLQCWSTEVRISAR